MKNAHQIFTIFSLVPYYLEPMLCTHPLGRLHSFLYSGCTYLTNLTDLSSKSTTIFRIFSFFLFLALLCFSFLCFALLFLFLFLSLMLMCMCGLLPSSLLFVFLGVNLSRQLSTTEPLALIPPKTVVGWGKRRGRIKEREIMN